MTDDCLFCTRDSRLQLDIEDLLDTINHLELYTQDNFYENETRFGKTSIVPGSATY